MRDKILHCWLFFLIISSTKAFCSKSKNIYPSLFDISNTNVNEQLTISKKKVLYLSDIPQDRNPIKRNDRHADVSFFKNFKLPPKPEDPMVMIGDIFTIFVYTFMDHTVNYMCANTLNTPHTTSTGFPLQLPVWLETTPSHIDITTTLHHFYSPATDAAGISAILLTSCWLLNGYFNKAFLFRNTISCKVDRVVWVTAKTWAGTAVLMVGLALASDWIMGWMDGLHQPSVGGLMKADADYIFDSFSVLVLWRFILSLMLGDLGEGGSGNSED